MRTQEVDKLKPPCTYQGGKQRLAEQIIDIIDSKIGLAGDVLFYDLCCGSGAVSLCLLNKGFKLDRLVMLDASSYGLFYELIGSGKFDLGLWDFYVKQVPERERVQEYLEALSKTNADEGEVYKYLLLQAGAFGGKQIHKSGNKFGNTSFRSYWQPTETSNRRAPVNPLSPMLEELDRRVHLLAEKLKGLRALHCDIYKLLQDEQFINCDNKVIYIDPPYLNSTKYCAMFDLLEFLTQLKSTGTKGKLFISEGVDLRQVSGLDSLITDAVQLKISEGKGGIKGDRKKFKSEWLNMMTLD